MISKIILSILLTSCFLAGNLWAQNGTISGEVVSRKGIPIEYAKVKIQGSNTGATTDAYGHFEIKNLKVGTVTLEVKHFDFESAQETLHVKANEVVKVRIELNAIQSLDEISVNGYQQNKYFEDSAFVVGKLPLKDIENPQVYNNIQREVLHDQVTTNFNDAMKNATGVTRLWESTGRGGDGAEYYSMRGFSVQPTMVNGLPGLNNGVIDPANVESIQVIKGPSGTLFGSSVISYGGLINVTTKKPYDKFGGGFSYTTGSFGLNRLTVDINAPVSSKSSIRLNGAFNEQQSFQDAGFRKSFYVAPSFKFQPTERLTFLINTEFLQAEAANAPMIFLNRYTPLSFSGMELFDQNYNRSFTSNDLTIKNPTFSIQAQALYKMNEHWTSQTAISRSTAKTDGYYHYLWDLGDGDSFYRYISKRNGQTQSLDVQQNFIGDFKIGSMRNRVVAGLDFYESEILNSSSGWLGNGIVTLSDGNDSGDLTQVGVDSLLVGSFEGNSKAKTQVVSAYVSNVINILPNLSAMASLRLDNFQGRTEYWTEDAVGNQLALSPKFGLVYQPVKDKVALFGNYMNGFTNIAPREVADADGTNVRMKSFDPEHANQYEFGVKTNILRNKIALTASYYNILVSNKLMTDPNNVNNTIQGGKVLSQGVELSLVASPIRGMNIIAGYSNNDAEVIEDNPDNGYLGLRPEEAGPAQVFNFWLTYELPVTKLKGLGIGVGGNGASEHLTMNRATTGSFALPAYQIYNASLFYRHKNYQVTLKANNLLDTKYYSGWSGVIPQQTRSIALNLSCNF